MKRAHWIGRCLGGLGLTLIASVGCQTYIPTTGQTLPSGRYLDYPPAYNPPSPPFPLPRELANMEKTAAAADAGALGGADQLPPPVPVPGRDDAPAPLAPPP